MPDDIEPKTEDLDQEEPIEEDEDDTSESEEDESQEDESDEEQEESEDDESEDELPEWARTKLTKANGEAAKYRTALRDAQDKLKGVKTLEEVDALIEEMKADHEKDTRDLQIENVALKSKLPESLQKRISGTTLEEMEADAKELAELFLPKKSTKDDDEEDDPELEGGLEPRNNMADETDPRKLQQLHGRGRRSR